jgi:hypothetical protein
MKSEQSFPDMKISEAFLEFAEPLLAKEQEPPALEEIENALRLAMRKNDIAATATTNRPF